MTHRMVALVVAAWALAGCSPTGTGFLCGLGLDEDPDAIRRCTRPHEVCICATNSCAQRELPTKECPSGLRYVKAPFSAEALQGACVATEHQKWIIAEDATAFACGATAPQTEPETLP